MPCVTLFRVRKSRFLNRAWLFPLSSHFQSFRCLRFVFRLIVWALVAFRVLFGVLGLRHEDLGLIDAALLLAPVVVAAVVAAAQDGPADGAAHAADQLDAPAEGAGNIVARVDRVALDDV